MSLPIGTDTLTPCFDVWRSEGRADGAPRSCTPSIQRVNGRGAIYRLALAWFLSGTGSGMAAIALSADIYRRTGSAVWLSATFFLTFGIAGLLNPVAGLIVDRFDRQRVMVTSDVAGAIVWSVLLLGQSPAWLLALGFIASAVSRPFGIACNAPDRRWRDL